jgi:hypothetical protein
LPKLITFEPPPCICRIRKIQNPISDRIGLRPDVALVGIGLDSEHALERSP